MVWPSKNLKKRENVSLHALTVSCVCPKAVLTLNCGLPQRRLQWLPLTSHAEGRTQELLSEFEPEAAPLSRIPLPALRSGPGNFPQTKIKVMFQHTKCTEREHDTSKKCNFEKWPELEIASKLYAAA